jgi:hypothetical protein
MSNLEIAIKLREQIKEQWPYVSTILVLYANNTDGRFTERIQDMIDRLMPREAYYYSHCYYTDALLKTTTIVDYNIIEIDSLGTDYVTTGEIKSLPINQVLFSSEDNPLGILK